MLLTVPGKSGGGAGGAGGGASVNVVQQVPNKVVLQAPSPGAAGKTASTITGIAQVQRANIDRKAHVGYKENFRKSPFSKFLTLKLIFHPVLFEYVSHLHNT